jgi:protein-S-isoprenylcysteine O-methyltransferase Ste14
MDAEQTSRPTAVPWPPILFVAALILAWLLGRTFPLNWPGLDDWPARLVGYSLGAAGLALVIWGLLSLLRARTTFQPNRQAVRLVTEGAFAFRRNPIYMGEVLLILGLAEPTHNVWFAAVAPLFAIAIQALAILPEERHLEERFGQDYLDYKERTRRWF